MTTEAEFQAQVVELATLCGWAHLHVRRSIGKGQRWTTATNLTGWPDLLLWRGPGEIIAAELKTDTGRVTDEQTAVLESLATAGIETHVWRPADFPEIVHALRRHR